MVGSSVTQLHQVGFAEVSRLLRRPRLQRFGTQLRHRSQGSDVEADLLRETSWQQQ